MGEIWFHKSSAKNKKWNVDTTKGQDMGGEKGLPNMFGTKSVKNTFVFFLRSTFDADEEKTG